MNPQSLQCRPIRFAIRLLILMVGILAPGGLFIESVQAATFTVTRTDDPVPDGCSAGDCSLREAIIAANAAAGADVITLPAGSFLLQQTGRSEEGALTGDLDIRGDLTINGAGQNTTNIDANQIDRVLHIHSGIVTINAVTIRNGLARDDTGGGIKSAGDLTINNSSVVNNTARYGAGIHNSLYGVADSNTPGGPTYAFTDISGSGTALGLGNDSWSLQELGFAFVYYGESHDEIYITTEGYLQFTAEELFYCCGDPTGSNRQLPSDNALYNSIVPFWDALSQGAGNIYVETVGTAPNRQFIVQYHNVTVGGNPLIFQVILLETSNQILFQYVDVEDVDPSLDDATQGGGATTGLVGPEERWDSAQYSHDEPILTDELAVLFTPAIGNLVLDNVIVSGNEIGGTDNDNSEAYDTEGAGVYSNGNATIVSSRLIGNNPLLGSVNGGGIGNRGGTVVISDTMITGNIAGENGGGISNRFGLMTVESSNISDNTVTCNDEPTGGGIHNRNATLIIRNSQITNNLLQTDGNCNASGAGLFTLQGTVTIDDSVISGNSFTLSDEDGSGGGIQAIQSTVTIRRSQVNDNSTDSGGTTGGGIDGIKSRITLIESTVAGNTNYSPDSNFDSAGGGIRTDQSSLSISDSQIVNNMAVGGSGGGIAHFAPPSYTVIDSNLLGGPTYNFIDISGSGTPLSLADDAAALDQPIGFDFAFYGDTFDVVSVSSNGYLIFNNGDPDDFEATATTNGGNQCGEDFGAPNQSIFAFLDDLDPGSGGEIYIDTIGSAPNRQFIVQYDDIPFSGDPDSGTVTFQVILFEDSDEILLQFADVEQSDRAGGRDADVALEARQSALGSNGNEFPNVTNQFNMVNTWYFECNTESTRLENGLAVLFQPIGDMVVTRSVVESNTAGSSGGGILHHGYFTGGMASLLATLVQFNIPDNISDTNGTLAQLAGGTIIVVKETMPTGGTDFEFTSDFTSTFTLNDDQSISVAGLITGTYAVTETDKPGWTLASATCSDGSPASAISIVEGETVTCTFVNAQQVGTIRLVKDVNPDDATANFVFDVTGPTPYQANVSGDDVVTNTVAVGSYTIVEQSGADTEVGQYTTTYACTTNGAAGSAGSGTSVTVNVNALDSVVCTFTNTRKSADTDVVKTVGTSPAGCANTTSISVNANTPVYYCVTINNTGAVTLTTHQISDPALGVAESVARELAPGASVSLTAVDIPELIHVPNQSITNTVTVTSSTVSTDGGDVDTAAVEVSTTATGSAVVTVTNPTGIDEGEQPAAPQERLLLPLLPRQEN